jgi:hypothetical protein
MDERETPGRCPFCGGVVIWFDGQWVCTRCEWGKRGED